MKHKAVKKLLFMFALVTITPASVSQIEGAKPGWVNYFGSPMTDWNNRFIELRGGQLLAAGYEGRNDDAQGDWSLVLTKFDSDGSLLWQRRIQRPGLDAAWAVRELASGNAAVAGFSDVGGAGGQDMHLAVFSSGGNLQWEGWYGGARDDRATDLLVIPDGGFLLVGQTESEGAGEQDVFAIRTDANGLELWRKAYGTKVVDRGFFAALTPDGNVAIAGVTGVQGNYDYLLMKIAVDGRLLWRRVVKGIKNDANHGVAMLADGTIAYVGYGASWARGGNDVSVLRFAGDGQLISHEVIGGPGDDRVQFAATDPNDGGVWLTGYTKSFSDRWRMLIIRVERSGRIKPYVGAIGANGDVNGATVAMARNGNLLLGGYTTFPSGGTAPADAFAMRINPDQIDWRSQGIEVRRIKMRCTGTIADMTCE